jgi:hypothetical protein
MEGTPSEGVPAKALVAMKFSTEAIVAAAVAVVFAVLTLGAIVREQGAPGNRLTNLPALNQMAALGFHSSSSRPLLGGTGHSQLLAQY